MLGRPVAYSGGYARMSWAQGIFRDDFFAHRVDSHDIDVSGMEPLELGHHDGHHWWTLDELRTTAETVYPWGLVGLLTDLLAGRAPVEPVELPWHH